MHTITLFGLTLIAHSILKTQGMSFSESIQGGLAIIMSIAILMDAFYLAKAISK
jgi:hypothetical protein